MRYSKNHTDFVSPIRHDPLHGGVMGSNADSMKISLKPHEFTYPSYPAEAKMGMELASL